MICVRLIQFRNITILEKFKPLVFLKGRDMVDGSKIVLTSERFEDKS